MNDHSTTRPARSTAEIATPQAARYLTQLCKHFEHRLPVTLGDAAGHIIFTIGDCRLRAEQEMLLLSLEAPDDVQLLQLQDVVGRHLLRFAFREGMQIAWCLDQPGRGQHLPT
jgi:hypothetical protein